MRHEQSGVGHNGDLNESRLSIKDSRQGDFVLEKTIFNNVFEKDIRRVFLYKKAERLAKAIHLVSPAFAHSTSLKNRVDTIAVSIIDAALLPPTSLRASLSHELLALSSMLSVARTCGFLSLMNVEMIEKEAHMLLQEVAAYEEPRVLLEEVPSLSEMARKTRSSKANRKESILPIRTTPRNAVKDISDTAAHIKDRRNAILSIIRGKSKASIKDISTLVRNVSEKTIQRELAELINEGIVLKQGERRWSTYSLAQDAQDKVKP